MTRCGANKFDDEPRPELYTVKDVAGILKVSGSLVYALIDSGRIPACRVGRGRGAVRVLKQDLLDYIENNRVQIGGASKPRPATQSNFGISNSRPTWWLFLPARAGAWDYAKGADTLARESTDLCGP